MKKYKADGAWGRLVRSDWFWPLYWIIFVKLLFFIISGLDIPLGETSSTPFFTSFLRHWMKWDTVHYMNIAVDGYKPHLKALVFYPLLPWLIRCATLFISHAPVAGLIVSNIASTAGLLIFYRLAREEIGSRAASYALIAILLFPTAYFFNAIYTEGLFLLLAAGGWLAARRNKWWAVGLFGGLAALSRINGALLLPAFFIQFWENRRRDKVSWKQVLWLALIPACHLIYFLVNQVVFGDPFAFQAVLQGFYHKHFGWPWTGMAYLLQRIPMDWQRGLGFFLARNIAEVAASIIFIATPIVSFFFLRPSFTVYAGLNMLLSLSTSFLLSEPRYLLSNIPLFLLLGLAGERYPRWFFLAGLISISLAFFYLLRFTAGLWAF